MVTVGYGDMSPVNSLEQLICIILMLITCGVFAYAVGKIGQIFEELDF